MSNHSVFARVGDFPGLQRPHSRKRVIDLWLHFSEEIIGEFHPTDVERKTKVTVVQEVLLKALPE